jgi:hypothetical protein
MGGRLSESRGRLNYEIGKMKKIPEENRLNRKAPQKRFLRGYSVPEYKKRLLLGGCGFTGAHFEAFFAENAAALFGSFFKLLSHMWRELLAEGACAVN